MTTKRIAARNFLKTRWVHEAAFSLKWIPLESPAYSAFRTHTFPREVFRQMSPRM